MLLLALSSALTPAPPLPDEVDFLRDVFPIFEAHCIECHGPDKQKGRLRLDQRDGLFGSEPGAGVVVPGDLVDSLLYELVTLPADDVDIMPAEGEKLSEEQLDVLRRWIEEGAAFEQPATPASEPEPLMLAPLTPEQAAARDASVAALAERGLHAMQVARGLEALDLNLSLARESAGDEDARLLGGLAPVLVWLNLSGTALTDAGLEAIGGLGELRRLNLSRTAVTDAGLAQLAGLEHLEYLNLYGTRVSDAGLAHLSGLKALRKLYLWQTDVSDAGVEALLAALPEVEVNRGASLAVVEVAQPVNAKCPVSGQDVNKAVTSEVDGELVAFCCADCKAKFDADPAAFAGKIPELVAAAPVNAKCPVSGKDVNAECTSEVDGKLVAFCCGDCKAKFDADPSAFLDKLPELARAAVNTTCPVSGKDVNPECTSEVDGKLVAFCCGDCKAKFDADPAPFLEKLGLGK